MPPIVLGHFKGVVVVGINYGILWDMNGLNVSIHHFMGRLLGINQLDTSSPLTIGRYW